jgi:hypothetical protein
VLEPKKLDAASINMIGLSHIVDPTVYLNNNKKIISTEKAIPTFEMQKSISRNSSMIANSDRDKDDDYDTRLNKYNERVKFQ